MCDRCARGHLRPQLCAGRRQHAHQLELCRAADDLGLDFGASRTIPTCRVSRHLDPHRVARRADAPRALRSGRGEPTLRGAAMLAKPAAATARDARRIDDAAVEAGCDLAAIRRAYNVGGAIGDHVRATASPNRCLCGSTPWPPGPPSCRQVRRFAEEVVPAVRKAAAASLRSPVPFEASRLSELSRQGEAVEGGPADGL
jgi:hypothetical protein